MVMDDIMWWRLINSSIYVFVKCSARFGKKLPQRMRNGSILKKNWRFIFAFDSTVFWITSRASTFSAISRLSSRFSMAGVPFVSTLGSLMPDLVTAPASH